MANPSTPLVRLSGLTKKFGAVTAVRNLNFQIHQGDFVAIFGPNGAGKTTLLKMVAGLTSPTSGQVIFGGDRAAAARAETGYVSHQTLLYNELTGRENLLFYARLYGLEGTPDLVDSMLARVGLADARHMMVRGFSRGMKQRLTLARALLHEPRLLLLDEPYTGLDQHGSRLLTRLLGTLREERRTVLMITHNLAEGLELSTRLMILHRGRLAHQARQEELTRSQLENLYFEIVER